MKSSLLNKFSTLFSAMYVRYERYEYYCAKIQNTHSQKVCLWTWNITRKKMENYYKKTGEIKLEHSVKHSCFSFTYFLFTVFVTLGAKLFVVVDVVVGLCSMLNVHTFIRTCCTYAKNHSLVFVSYNLF